MNSANCSQSDFNKTKKSFPGKKNSLNVTNLVNFRDTLNVFSFNNSSTFDKRNTTVNIKVKEKQEYEFPNIKTMKKELSQKMYSKESGEIITAVKESNDNLRQFNNTSFKPEFNTINSSGFNKTVKQDSLNSYNKLRNSNLFNLKSIDDESKIEEIPSIRKKYKNNFGNSSNELKSQTSFKNKIISNNIKIGDRYNYETSNEKTDNENSSPESNRKNIFKSRTTLRGNSLIEPRKSLYVTESNGTNIRELMELKSKRLSQISWDALNKIFSKKNQGFYCPHCSHCNNMKDEALDTYLAMKEAKSIINKGFDYICEYYDTDQSFLDFMLNIKQNENSNNNNNIKVIKPNNPNSKNHFPMSISNINNNMNLINSEIENIKDNKKKDTFDIETLFSTYPKSTNDRNVLQLVTHFLDALITDKVSLNTIISPDIYEKLKNSLITQGIAFVENDTEIEFDKELDLLFDQNTREKIRNLFSEKFQELEKIQTQRQKQQEKELFDIRKRFMILFL